MSGSAMALCPSDSALMLAWNAYKESDDYKNSFEWATKDIPQDDLAEIERVRASGANPWTRQMKVQAVEGSLWSAFSRGWFEAGGVSPFERKS